MPKIWRDFSGWRRTMLVAWNGIRSRQFEPKDNRERTAMGRNVTLGIGTLIIILIIVALVF